MARILFIRRGPASFIDIDRDLLAIDHDVHELVQAGPRINFRALTSEIRSADLVFGWFAGWHMVAPIALARALHRPSLVVIGGVDVANMPEIGYGMQQPGPRRWMSRFVIRTATRLMTNSHYSQAEIHRNLGVPASRVAVVHHGVPDPYGALPTDPRERLALSVGVVDERNLARKGLLPFVEAAALLPDVEFVLAGRATEAAAAMLRPVAGANVRMPGFVSDAERDMLFRRAAVYVQPSRHEGFGMSVAESMLAGCIPVVTRAGALPEVVGDAGVFIDSDTPAAVAAGVRLGLDASDADRARARAQVLENFPMERRQEGLRAVVADALASSP